MATSIQTATVAVPLLFVVVTELSAAGREMDLKEIAGKDPFLFNILPDWFFPQLGRFNFIHGMNTVLLGFGIALESYFLPDGVLRLTLPFVTWLGWVILPAIEVKDYDSILEGRSGFHSVHIHTVGTIVGGLYACYLPKFVGLSMDSFGQAGYVILALTSIAVAYAIYTPYMTRLQQELIDQNPRILAS